jgi:hypothetical protein
MDERYSTLQTVENSVYDKLETFPMIFADLTSSSEEERPLLSFKKFDSAPLLKPKQLYL